VYNPSEDTNDVQSLRCTQFRKGAGKPENLPPTRDALRHHILRANYQAFIWRTSNVANQQIPCPTTSGWTLSQTSLTPILMTQDGLSADCVAATTCRCKEGGPHCRTGHCLCQKSRLRCTRACLCGDWCSNPCNDDAGSD